MRDKSRKLLSESGSKGTTTSDNPGAAAQFNTQRSSKRKITARGSAAATGKSVATISIDDVKSDRKTRATTRDTNRGVTSKVVVTTEKSVDHHENTSIGRT